MYIDHFYGEFFGYPIQNLYKLKKKERHKEYVSVKSILDKYYKENSPEIEIITGVLFKFMELEIFHDKVREDEVKSFFEKMNNADNGLKKISNLMDTLSVEEKRKLYLSYSEDLIYTLKKNAIKAITKNVLEKEVWDKNDALIGPYLNQLLGLIIKLREEIKNSKESEINAKTQRASFLIGFYSVVLYGYIKGKLNPQITMRRYSELVSSMGVATGRGASKVQYLVDKIENIPLPE